jgi:hypothetical protein
MGKVSALPGLKSETWSTFSCWESEDGPRDMGHQPTRG